MIPTSTDITFTIKKALVAKKSDTVVFFFTADEETARIAADEYDIKRLIDTKLATGRYKEVTYQVLETSHRDYRTAFYVGLGKKGKITPETLRQVGARILRVLIHNKIARASVVMPKVGGIGPAIIAEAICSGAMLAAFRYDEYKGTGQKKEETPTPKSIEWTIVSEDIAAVRTGVDRARAICDGQNFARTIASRPANDINPLTLAKVARQFAQETSLTCKILDERQMAKLGMGGILAVGAGAIQTPPRMIVLEYRGARGKTSAPLLVVGKSITFDTGGISIKPAEKMGNMIYDKCGGMAVLGLMYALAKLKLPVNVVGILSSAENAVSSKSYRPGDILRMYNGVTVDVTNTDAEGRLVLGDALAWGIEKYKPAAVVDLATLTGGVVTALGKTMAGVMANNDALARELIECAAAVGEKVWQLPLGEDQRDQIRADHADIVNSAGREAHPLQGGAFLSFFVPTDGSVPWAHLDIAGVADTEKEMPYYAKGPTGWGVRTLVKWVESRATS